MSQIIKPTDPVADSEYLFRSVRLSDAGYRYEDGKVRISASAFNDRNKQPSVDRAFLINNDPCKSQKSASDCVVSLLTKKVRKEKVERNGSEFILDVQADPLQENLAHAKIIPSPEYRNDKDFKKVKESLARMATLMLEPST